MTRDTNINSGYSLIIFYLATFTMLIGIITLLPLVTLFFYIDEIDQAKYFILPGLSAILVGYLISSLMKKYKDDKLHQHQDIIIVVASWFIAIIICSIPFLLTGKLNFSQSVFEATSGFTTTGVSVIDVSTTPKIFLIHRTSMQFFGGVGLILIVMSVLSDTYGMRLYNAEGHIDKLVPNIIKSARIIISIYSGYILGGILLYVLFGMPLFDAINHSITAVATAGFSTKLNSIGHYNSVSIEIITMVLMIFGGTNFFVSLLLLTGKVRQFFEHCEVKFMIIISITFTFIITFLLMKMYPDNISRNLRDSAFHVISMITTTGFQTIPSFKAWPSPIIFLALLLMLIGGALGSTSGGIKLYRIYVILKCHWWTIRDCIHHRRIIKVNQINRFGKLEKIDDKIIKEASAYTGMYIMVLLLGTFIFTLYGNSLEDSLFEFASLLGSVGLSIGIVSYDSNPVILWTSIIGMIIGRLEIYAIFFCGMRIYCDIKLKISGN
jgi:trk system potassium uptake protein